MERLALALGIIFVSLVSGYFCKLIAESKNPNADILWLKLWRKRMQSIAIYFLIPLSSSLSLWGLPKPDGELLLLPLLGLITFICGGVLAVAISKLIKLDRRQAGSLYSCGSFSNIGAVGSLICLLYIGENTIALAALYRLLEEAYYFSVAIPVARLYSQAKAGFKFGHFMFTPVLGIILFALATGIALNLLNITRPDFMGTIASASILTGTFFLLFAIGLSLRISIIRKYIPEGLYMCAIKFICTPLIITTLAYLLGLATYDNGIVLKSIVILSSMPVAMNALAIPTLCDLDVDLANTCWIISTLGLIIILPVLAFILPFI